MHGATLPRLAECRTCHEPIRFITMEQTGRAMPVNPAPTSGDHYGYVAARLRGHALIGYVLSTTRGVEPGHPLRFRPHYATCTRQAPATPTTTPEPADPALF